MKRMYLFFFLVMLFKTAFSQDITKNDTIFLLNKEMIICKVVNVSELHVDYNYVGESVTNSLSKKLIKEIHFASGRFQKISELIIINGEQDWEKVQITTLQDDVVGLVNKGEVKGKAYGITGALTNMTKVKVRAEEQIKREAAKLGAHIILIQSYNVANLQYKTNINGVAYGYK